MSRCHWLFFPLAAVAFGACGGDDSDSSGGGGSSGSQQGGAGGTAGGGTAGSAAGQGGTGGGAGGAGGNGGSSGGGGAPPGGPLAFPGAEGFGAKVSGGRGGSVIKVTNLDSSGPGSLAWAVAQPGPRIVVFEVSGVIAGDVNIPHGDLTIAGQTAPCAGITLNGTLSTTYGDAIGNIIVRHLRISPPNPTGPCSAHDAVQFSTAHGIMLDHIDASHAGDEIIDFWGGAHDITVQWSSIVYPISGGAGACDHPKGLINHRACIDSGSCSSSDPLGGRISVHHNLFAHCQNRTPALSTGPADVINNIVYNGREGFVHHNVAGAHSTDPAAIGEFNIIGNSYIEGPSASLAPLWFDPENSSGPIPTRYYVFDNWVEDNAFNGRFDNPYTTPGFDNAYSFACCGVEASQFESAAFDFSGDPAYAPVTVQAPTDAYTNVLARAGAWPRDVITRTAVQDVESRGGQQTNFVPSDFLDGLSPCSPPVDGDDDGMSDDWEMAHGLDPATPDADQVRPSGYTAIEEYINELADSLVGS